ncbi:hypothetical protein HDU99_006075, partial [Rhizoclosmatium hyalinum]
MLPYAKKFEWRLTGCEEQGLRSGPTPPLTATPKRQTEEPIKATEPSEAAHSADSANVAMEPL